MDITACLDSGEKLEFTDALPHQLLHYRLMPRLYTASGPWGRVILQVFRAEGFTVCYSVYLIKQNTCLYLQSPIETNMLHLAVKGSLDMEPQGMPRTLLKEEQFNLSYFPAISIRRRFEPGEYAGIDINFSKEYFRQFTPYLTGFQAFLNDAASGIGAYLCPVHLYANPPILAVIKNLLQCRYGEALERMYIELEVQALLVQVILATGQESNHRFVVTPADTRRMEAVRHWLLDNYREPGTLNSIARQFRLNDYRLKRDFKAVFGITVFDFVNRSRMQQAEKLLLQTDTPVTQIAYLVGYRSAAHFSGAFKKWFGYSPNQLRRNGNGSL